MNNVLQELSLRGFVSQCTAMDELSSLMDAEPVTFYVGCDPTGSSLHIGHMVPFFAFRHLRAAGHRGIALIGSGTARIGDPSGKTEMRKMLNCNEIEQNAAFIREQLERFLGGFDGESAICADNSGWLPRLNYIDFLREVGVHFSVNRMLSFEAYKKRLETGLSFIEFNYQLLQSYDFFQLYKHYGCRLQIGGDDQWGNIVAGMELIRRMENAEETPGSFLEPFGLTFPLVTTSDGKKMGKTEKGALFLDPARTAPYDFFQYWRNITDSDLKRFLLMFTFLPVSECERLAGLANPNEGKERLAFEVTALIHGKDEAEKALSGAKAAFGGGGDINAMPAQNLEKSKLKAGYNAVELFFDSKLCSTKSEARRLIEQGGAFVTKCGVLTAVKNVEEVISTGVLDDSGALIIRAGKKRFCRVFFVE
ncbi:MAG: tyrosine--tRNA ligase [Termitinemataceae bacterium]|nr:MAG: tyrosine--tRNA ligase [Termitinemataceae bacterium]